MEDLNLCQQDIINYLKKKKRYVDMRELLVNIPANRASISRNCRKLRENKEVGFKKKTIKSYEKFLYFI